MSSDDGSPKSAFAIYRQQQQTSEKSKKKKRKPSEKPSTNEKKPKLAAPEVKNDDDEEVPQLIEIKPKAKVEKLEKVDKTKKKSKKIKFKISKVNGHDKVVKKEQVHKIRSNECADDCDNECVKLFKWLINPIPPDLFFHDFWEKEPIHIDRNCAENYYRHILTTERLDRILRENPLYYTRNIDVVSYENGVKENFNQEGRAIAAALWDYYSNGCSIRVLNPQTYDKKVHLLLATLQEYFGTMVGANTYLTPAGSQGFAPHYDDIEAFVIQLEGRKHWRLYRPKGSDVLARDSSPNLNYDDIGEPFMEVTLNAGDLLYFPRGMIHEGRTDPDSHSFHITVSVYQHTAYADLLEHILPDALKRAAQQNIEFRKGLPLNYLKQVGLVNKNKKSPVRTEILKNVKHLVSELVNYVDVDHAADQLGKNFMHDAMPPVLSRDEVILTSKGDGDYMRNGKVYNRVEIGLDTCIRLVRYYSLRVVKENDSVSKIFYSCDNAKVYHGEDQQWLELENILIPALEKLQSSYPNFVEVEDLPINEDSSKVQLVSDLWEKGLLVTKAPLAAFSGEDDSEDFEEDLEYSGDTIEILEM